MCEIKFLEKIDKEQWDAYVKNHPFGWISHQTHWKETVEKSFKHIKGYFLILIENGSIKAGLPIYFVKSLLTGKRLVSIPFATLCDPLVNSQKEAEILFSESIGIMKRLKAFQIEIRSFHANYLNDGNFSKIEYYKHHYINLEKRIEEIKKSFHRSCVRQRINRAEKSGIKIRVGQTEEDIKTFYHLYKITRKRLFLPTIPFIFLKNLWLTFSANQNIEILLAEKDGKAISGLLLFKFKDRVSAEAIGSDDNYNHLSPNHLLFWEAIHSAWAQGFKIFDFGRTSPENHTLMEFKNRWGTHIVDLPIYFYPGNKFSKSLIKERTNAYKLTQKLCQITPLQAYEFLGKIIYSHLA